MKITRIEPPKEFRPVVITLETAPELDELRKALNWSKWNCLAFSTDYNSLFIGNLINILEDLK